MEQELREQLHNAERITVSLSNYEWRHFSKPISPPWPWTPSQMLTLNHLFYWTV